MAVVMKNIETKKGNHDVRIDWLDEISNGWHLKRIKHLLDIFNGQEHKHVVSDSGFPVIGSGGQFAYATDYLFDGEVVLLGRKGTIDKPLHFFGKFWTVDTMFYAVPRKPNRCKYLYYLCTTIPFSFYSTSTAIPSMTQNDLNNHFVLVPTPEEQTRIVDFLDKKTTQIDQAIAKKERLIELLKERRQIMIHKAVTQGIKPDVKMKSARVEWIGEIPDHWEIVANRSLFSERKEPGNDELPLLSVSIHSAVSTEEVEDNIQGRVKIEDRSKYQLVEVNDITFNMMRAWQGAIGAVQVKGMVSPAYVVAKPIKKINSHFFEYQHRTSAFIQQINRNSKGITDFRKRLYWGEFKQLLTVLPSLEEQGDIVQFIDQISIKIDVAIDAQIIQIEKLKEYKTTLINSAVTGKIRVV